MIAIDFTGSPDSEMPATGLVTADSMDKLDLSVSSVDMNDTSLAMNCDKEDEISGVGKLGCNKLIVGRGLEGSVCKPLFIYF